MSENNVKTRNKGLVALTEGAVIAAMYAVLTLVLAPISYGAIQLRVSEALTILPVRKRSAVAGLVVGCAIANGLGVLLAVNACGVADILFGTLATLAAAITTRLTRKLTVKGVPVVSALMPVLFNGLVIGAELTIIYQLPFVLTALEVATGELLAVCVLGLPLNALIGRMNILKEDD